MNQKNIVRAGCEFGIVPDEPEAPLPDEFHREDFRMFPVAIAPFDPFVGSGEFDPQRPSLLLRCVIVEKTVERILPDVDSSEPGDGVVENDPALLFEGCRRHA